MGTPKTLSEAIKQGIEATAHEYVEAGRSTTKPMEIIIKDFISQKVGAAMLDHPESENVLMGLFDKLVRG